MSHQSDKAKPSADPHKWPRKTLKKAAYVFFRILAFPFVLLVRLGDILRIDFYPGLATGLSLLPGLSGSYMRLAFYKGVLPEIGNDVHIGFGTFFSKREAKVGNNVNIGAYCVIGKAHIGSNVFIASKVSITSGKHQHTDAILTHDHTLNPRFESITIGNWTWIGEGAIVMADIGNNSVVASGAVVTRPMPDGKLIAGNPARILDLRPTPSHG